jgi:hypothetical protein
MYVGFHVHDVVAMCNFEVIFKERSLCTCVILAVVSDDLWSVGIENVTVGDLMLHQLVNGYQRSGGI